MKQIVIVVLSQLLVVNALSAKVAEKPGAYFPLVDGDRQAVIVGKGSHLPRIIKRCTGRELKMVREARYKPAKNDYPLYIGDTAKGRTILKEQIKKLDAEGYIFHITPKYAIVYCKKQTTSTGNLLVYSMASFARRYLGFDQYMQGKLFEEYPKHEKVLIPCETVIENPGYKHRQWSAYGGAGLYSWRMRMSGGGGRYKFHHNLYRIISPKKYRDHPEYFPVIKESRKKRQPRYRHLKPGQRYVPTDEFFNTYWQPCTENEDVRKITIDAILNYFAKTGKRAFSLGTNDSGGYCYCEKCLKATPPGIDPLTGKAVAHRIYKFYNHVAEKVAEKYPDARLGFLMYQALNDCNSVKLHPSLVPFFTQNMADCFDLAYKKRNYDTITKIAKIAPHFGLYEYLFGKGFFIPRIYSKNLVEGLRFAYEKGAEGFYAEASPNWGLDGPKLWILEQVLWDPSLKFDVLLTKWCDGMFHEASKPMNEYFSLLEEIWNTQQPSNARRGMYRLWSASHKKEQFTEVFTPEKCGQALKVLDRAAKVAKTERVKKRIAYFKAAFQATNLASTRFQSAEKIQDGLKQERATKQKKDLYDWMILLDDWAKLGKVDDYMRDLREKAPLSFNEFCAESSKKTKPENWKKFNKWDMTPSVVGMIVSRIANKAATKPTSCANREQFDIRIKGLLDGYARQAKNDGRDITHTLASIREMLPSFAINGKRLEAKPIIDGEIESTWGKPQVTKPFYKSPFFNTRSENQTKVWIGTFDQKLYVAFACRQNPATIINKISGRDDVKLRANGRVASSGFNYLAPYIRRVDSVGFNFPDRRVVYVTAAGGVFDAKPGSGGWDPSWNGAEIAVTRDDKGWNVEIEVTLSKKEFNKFCTGTASGVNFFRCEGSLRTAWITPPWGKWFIWPRAGGFVFWNTTTNTKDKNERVK